MWNATAETVYKLPWDISTSAFLNDKAECLRMVKEGHLGDYVA